MRNDADHRPGRWLMPLLAGAVLGPALQVQQESLWPWRRQRWSPFMQTRGCGELQIAHSG
jgi:hypothetical protein